MEPFEIIKQERLKKGWTQKKLGELSGLSEITIRKYESGSVPIKLDSLSKIANALQIDINYLQGKDLPYCSKCGFYYTKNENDHLMHHALWEKAVKKFGICIPYSIRESLKEDALSKIALYLKQSGKIHILPPSFDLYEEASDAVDTLFDCYFSESLEHSEYNLSHVNKHDYISMLLNQDYFRKFLGENLWEDKSDVYGVKEGIISGLYYECKCKSEENNDVFITILEGLPKDKINDFDLLNNYFEKLNSFGKKEAIKRIGELTEIDRYTIAHEEGHKKLHSKRSEIHDAPIANFTQSENNSNKE